MSRNPPTRTGPESPTSRSTPAAQRIEPARETTVCPRCGESVALAKVKGCVQCLACHFKFDCNGW